MKLMLGREGFIEVKESEIVRKGVSFTVMLGGKQVTFDLNEMERKALKASL